MRGGALFRGIEGGVAARKKTKGIREEKWRVHEEREGVKKS